MNWLEAILPSNSTDRMLRLGMILLLGLWNLFIGLRIEIPYPISLVEAYGIPLSRAFLLLLVVLSAAWCPTVGVLAALAYINLAGDVSFMVAA